MIPLQLRYLSLMQLLQLLVRALFIHVADLFVFRLPQKFNFLQQLFVLKSNLLFHKFAFTVLWLPLEHVEDLLLFILFKNVTVVHLEVPAWHDLVAFGAFDQY